MRRRRIRWLLTPLIWLKNILDHEWWADFIGEKSGAYERARRPNKFKEWKSKQPLWKQAFYRNFSINIDSISI